MHGWVSDATKAELYGRAWVSLTASSSEGWSLTVMEGALCRTPSAALAVGGLSESIVDGETGFLASTPDELIRRVREVIDDPGLRERLGDQRRAPGARLHVGALRARQPRRARAGMRRARRDPGRPAVVQDPSRVPA